MVDDGSRDRTAELVRAFAAEAPEVRLLAESRQPRQGLQRAQRAFCTPSGEVVMFTDADLSAPIEEAEGLFAAIAGGRRHRHRFALA